MKKFIVSTIVALLYLTPIGLVIGFMSIISGKSRLGISIESSSTHAIFATVKKNPSKYLRIKWFTYGTFLLIQTHIIVSNNIGQMFGTLYGWFASLLGLIFLFSALIPSIKWNNRWGFSQSLSLSKIEILFLITLIYSTGYSYLVIIYELLYNYYILR